MPIRSHCSCWFAPCSTANLRPCPRSQCRLVCQAGEGLAAFVASPAAAATDPEVAGAVSQHVMVGLYLACGCAALARTSKLPQPDVLRFVSAAAALVLHSGRAMTVPAAHLLTAASGSPAAEELLQNARAFAGAAAQTMLYLLSLASDCSDTALQSLAASSLSPVQLLPWVDSIVAIIDGVQQAERQSELACLHDAWVQVSLLPFCAQHACYVYQNQPCILLVHTD